MAPAYRDRTVRLTLFGILAVFAGGFCILLGLAQLLAPLLFGLLPEAPLAVDARSMVVGMLVYAALGGVMIWAGIGSIRRRRWVRSVMLTLGWSWLLFGVLLVLLTWYLRNELLDLPGPDGWPLPAETLLVVRVLVFGFETLAGIVVPAMFLWAYQSRDVLLTCESGDPSPGWADRCPAPVLGLSLGLAAAGVLALPMAVYAAFPLFGLLVSGWAGGLLDLALAVVCLLLARSTYRLSRTGWWATFWLFVLVGISTAATFAAVEPVEFLREMGYPEQQRALFQGISQPVAIWATTLLTLASLGYLTAVRKHFP